MRRPLAPAFVGKALAKAVEDSLDWATQTILARRRTEPEVEVHGVLIDDVEDPVALHLTALTDQLTVLRKAADFYSEEAPQHRQMLLRTAHRHLARLEELNADHDLRTVFDQDIITPLRTTLAEVEQQLAGSRGDAYGASVKEIADRARHISSAGYRPFSA